MSDVELRGVERRFGVAKVLSGLDLDVEAGERVTIVGSNGAGKTTLLRLMTGLLRCDDGVVRVLGGSPDDPRVRRRIGVVGHVPGLYPRMTASENLRFWGRMYDDPGAEVRGRDLLAELGLDPADRRYVAEYSQGMRQRVSIARALSTEPDLLVADEPFAGLDVTGTEAVEGLLDTRRSVVLATHDRIRREGGPSKGIRRTGRTLELVRGRLRPV